MVLAVTARVFGSVTMAPTIQFMHELHPTVLRAQGGALAAAIAYGSTFCSPYIINTVRIVRKEKVEVLRDGVLRPDSIAPSGM